MDGILCGILVASKTIYILVASKTIQEQQNHLNEVLKLISTNGLVINRAKSVFGVSKLTYLGYCINVTGIFPLPSRVNAIRDFPTLTSKASLQCFLGTVNYYHRFMP